MKLLTGVGAIISASHKGDDDLLHGHTWEIVAWFDYLPDAVAKQKELQQYLSVFEHSILPSNVSRGEHLAQTILYAFGCVKVDVNRPLERIFAQAHR